MTRRTKQLAAWLDSVWYGRGRGGFVLIPLAYLFKLLVFVRRRFYAIGLLKSERVAARVIIVGNLTAGGSGKTPLVGWLAKQLSQAGERCAIISRGYGADGGDATIKIDEHTSVATCGDEPKMLWQQTGVDVFVNRDRVAAARSAVAAGATLIIADDGLQHYRLSRDVEIVVIDAQRRLGNQRCLPAGPLREGVSRLREVDLVVWAGELEPEEAPVSYQLSIESARNAQTGEVRALSLFAGQRAHAIAGIGHPQRFYDVLTQAGISVLPLAAGDHEHLADELLTPADEIIVLMTEKDAVKYPDQLSERHWIVPANVVMSQDSRDRILRAVGPGSADAAN